MEILSYISPVDQQVIHATFFQHKQAKGLIVMFHGMAEHRHRYQAVAMFFQQHGYAVLTLTPTKYFSASLNGIYTGSMLLAKFSPNTDWAPNEYRKSSPFGEVSLKLGYTLPVEMVSSAVEIFGGIKNITNYFQSDSDNYKNRDSDYMYGPSQPRTFYVGIRLKSI